MKVLNFNNPVSQKAQNRKQTPSFKANQDEMTNVLLLSDIDGTWLHKEKGVDSEGPKNTLNQGLEQLKRKAKNFGINLMHGYVTARPSKRLMQVGLPEPSFSIVQNGGEIHKGDPTEPDNLLSNWAELNEKTGFNAEIINKTITTLAKKDKFKNMQILPMSEVVNSPEANACDFMQPFCIDNNSIKRSSGEAQTPAHRLNQVAEFLGELKADLAKKGQKAGENYIITGPYPFKGKDYVIFDLSSPKAHKGDAVNFLMKYINDQNNNGLKTENTIIACDGGNDISMCTDGKSENGDGRRLIIVGDNKELRENAGRLQNNKTIMRPEREISSMGVLAGLKAHLNDIYGQIRAQKGLSLPSEPAFTGNPFCKTIKGLSDKKEKVS